MPKHRLKKWRHPSTDALRIYLNGLETTEAKVWFERGARIGTTLPPEYSIDLHTDGQLTDEMRDEIAEAFSEMDLFLDKTTWARLGKAADW